MFAHRSRGGEAAGSKGQAIHCCDQGICTGRRMRAGACLHTANRKPHRPAGQPEVWHHTSSGRLARARATVWQSGSARTDFDR
jgi:hypothetical protein